MKRALLFVLSLAMLAGISRADVTSKAVTISPNAGMPQFIDLQLQSSGGVAGIQGQINYDSSIFSNPRVEGNAGSPGFTVMGNLVTPGQFRFIAYANPTKTFTLSQPVLQFRLDTVQNIPTNTTKTITYTMEAASSSTGASLANTNFSDITVVFKRNAAEDVWMLYR